MSYRKKIWRKNHNCSGFTLVQTMMVLIIVSLILAVVLSGARIYAQSRLFANGIKASVISSALNEFTSKYGALPGDFGDVKTTAFSSFGEPLPALPGCDNNPANSCRGGNLDGTIGRTDKAIFSALNGNDAGGLDQENILFWYHLAASDLFNSVAFKNKTTSDRGFGEILPASPFRGGYQIKAMGGFDSAKTGDAAAPDGLDGIFIVWQAMPFTSAENAFVVSPHQAAEIDRKYDDGQPLSGKITARGRNVPPDRPDGCRLSAIKYDEKNDGAESCYMIFQIGAHAGF